QYGVCAPGQVVRWVNRSITGRKHRTGSKRDRNMAKRCEVCNKGPVVGRTVSHAHNVGPRRFEPNLQTVRAVVKGATKRIRVCTRCLRDGKVIKAA
ncbi:MAG TPA: 50S ribosomal protein L28, partial [Vicinamibacterales bacterium]|nr:50S ribosomal protein L28 [Vicinamibacterales bacterium]